MNTYKQKLNIFVLVLALAATAISLAQPDEPAPTPRASDLRSLKQQIRYSSITSVFDPNDTVTDQGARLQKIIDSVAALEPPDFTPSKPQKPDQTQKISPAVKNVSTETQKTVAPPVKQLAEKQDPFQTIILKKSEQIVNPLAAAEALYKNKDMKNAAKYYRLELAGIDTDKTNVDRPWVIYQIANCLRRDDPAEAYKYYDQLLTEYPDYYCSSVARMQQEIITWYQKNNPSTVLEKYVSDPNSL